MSPGYSPPTRRLPSYSNATYEKLVVSTLLSVFCRKVVELAARCMPLLCVFIIFEGAVVRTDSLSLNIEMKDLPPCCCLHLQGVMGGAMRGAGLQPLGALTIFICLYIFSAPLGFSLLLKSSLKLMGALILPLVVKQFSSAVEYKAKLRLLFVHIVSMSSRNPLIC